MPPDPDADLRRRALAGDLRAQDQLLRRFERLVAATLRGAKIAGLEWEDLLQEGRVAAWGAIQSHDPARGALSSFVVHCVKHRLADLLRAQARGCRRILDDALRFVEDDAGPLVFEPIGESYRVHAPAAPNFAHRLELRLCLSQLVEFARTRPTRPLSERELTAVLGKARGLTPQDVAEETGRDYHVEQNSWAKARLKLLAAAAELGLDGGR